MAQLDPTDLTKILNALLPGVTIAATAIQSITSDINKSLTATANATQRLTQSLNFSDNLVQNMADNFDKIKNAVNGTNLGARVFDKKKMDDFAERFDKAQTIVDKLNNDVIQLQTNLRGISALDPTGTIINVDQIKADLAAATLALNYRIKMAEAIQNEAEAYVDLNQKQKLFNQALESKSGFDAFESSLGIFGKIPTVARGLEQMSLSAKMTIGVMYSVFQTVYDTFDQTQTAFIKTIKSFGLLKDDAETLNTFIKNTTVNLAKYGVTAEDVAATIGSMVDTFGSLTLFSAKTGEEITLISKQLGVGNKELTDSIMTLMSFGKIDMVKATKVAYFASALSTAAGVPLPKVMDDVAKAGDKARGMIKGGAEELVKAAVYARRLGTDLEKVAEIGRKMLDFQESITDEIEASVLLGSNISFQKARELFYTGKIQEGYDEIFKVVKNIGDFNKLDIFQKEAIAKSTGLSLTDLQKQLQIREDLNKVAISGTDEQKKMVQEYKKLTGQSGAVLENTADAAAQRIKDNINLKETEEIMARIKGMILETAKLLFPLIDGILKGVNAVLKFAQDKGGGGVFSAILVAAGIVSIIKLVMFGMGKLKLFKSLLGGVTTPSIPNVPGGTKESFFKRLFGGMDLKEAGAAAIVLISLAVAFKIIVPELEKFKNIGWEDLAKAGVVLVGLIAALNITAKGLSTLGPQLGAGLTALVTGLALAGAEAIATSPALGAIGLVLAVLTGLFLGAAYGVNLIGKGFLNAGQGVNLFGDGLLKAVSALVTYSKEVSTFTALNLAGVFVSLKSAINDFPLNDLQKIVAQFSILAASLELIAKFKYLPAIDTTTVASTMQPTPVIPGTTNTVSQTTNAPVNNSTSIIDAVRQGIKEGMNNISLNVYLDGQKIVTGLSKNVGFRQDTGGIAMQSSLT
jgi:hypothetical protein